nr:integrase, catalytic region, zinc finger, CCHC-type, peptidase aspartic, catalytic [Tanacetum cinerariifolium]
MEQFQVNTKFLNSLPPEWSKFVTDVKLVKDLHTTKFDQLHAYLEQHEFHANEVRLLREHNQDPLAFFPPSQYGSIHPTQHYSSTYPLQPQFNNSSVPPSYQYQSQMNHQPSSVLQIAYESPQVSTQPMTESPLVDSGFTVPVFSLEDDLIACLNKEMAFLTVVTCSRFPSINNQLRTSSNPRNQDTIQDGRVIVQQVQRRQGKSYFGTGYKSTGTSFGGNNASGQARVVKCPNCQGEGHTARQCTQRKRPRNATWYKDKAMLDEAQEARQILDEKQLALHADPGILDAVLMANIFIYGSDVISEEGHSAKDCKKAKVKDYKYYKTKMLLTKKDKDEQVLLAEDQAWMESSNDSDQEINANMVFMAQIEKVLFDSEASSSSVDEKTSEVSYYLLESESESEFETSEHYDNSTNYGLFLNNDDDQEIFHDTIESASENFIEKHIDSQKDSDKSDTVHMIMPSKDNLYNGRKGISFETTSYFEKAKDLRPTLYDEKVIGLGMCDLLDDNNFFIFDDESVRIYPGSKMPFKKKPLDSMHIFQICLWIIDSECSNHMTGNRALLTNFVEKFLRTVRFGNNDFAAIAGYGDVVIGSMTIKKVYYVEGLGHNLFSVGQFFNKGLEVAFRKSTCFVRNEDGVDLLTGDRSSNLYTIALKEVASNSSTCLLAKASSS